jgi:AraC-like DNA-binding protein
MKIINPNEISPVVRISNYHNIKAMEYRRHIPDLQLILVLNTTLTYQIEGKEIHTIEHGEVLFIEPGLKHILKSSKKEGQISGIHFEFLPEFKWVSSDYRLSFQVPVVTKTLDYEKIHSMFRHCTETYRSYGNYKSKRVNAIAQDILLYLCEQWDNGITVALNSRLQEMIQFIKDNLMTPITRHDIAEKFHISPEHVNLLFKKHLGVTPSDVINRERCNKAYYLLQHGQSVKQAAFACGYNDPFYFSRKFKQIFNITPKNIAPN